MPWASPDEPGPRSCGPSLTSIRPFTHTYTHRRLPGRGAVHLPRCGWSGCPHGDPLSAVVLLLLLLLLITLLILLFLCSGSSVVRVNVSSIFHHTAHTSWGLLLVLFLFWWLFFCFSFPAIFFLSTFLQAAWLLFLLLLLLRVTMLATMHHRHLCLHLSHKPCSDLPSPPCLTSSLHPVSHTLC